MNLPEGLIALLRQPSRHQKVKNAERDPRVAVNVCDVSRPSRYHAIRGRVIGITAEGGSEHIEALAHATWVPLTRGTGAATRSVSSLPSRRARSARAGGRCSVTISQPGNSCAHLDPASTGGSSTRQRRAFSQCSGDAYLCKLTRHSSQIRAGRAAVRHESASRPAHVATASAGKLRRRRARDRAVCAGVGGHLG